MIPSRMPSRRSRCGIALTGVAVTTSRPKTVSSTSIGTASGAPMVKISGLDAAQPTSPPAFCMAVVPSSRPGAPQAMCTRPSTPMTSADRPMPIRPLASGWSGWRMKRTAITPRMIGTSRSSRPKAPVISMVTRSPTGPLRFDQVPAATISARASSSSATPSLRWAGSRFLAPWPIPRKTAPTAWAQPSHRARSSRSTPPLGEGAGLAGAFLAGARLAGAAFLAAGPRARAAFFAGAVVRPVRPFAVPAVLWEPLPDVREAMGPRLPVRTTVDVPARPFTRSCRPRCRLFDVPPDLTHARAAGFARLVLRERPCTGRFTRPALRGQLYAFSSARAAPAPPRRPRAPARREPDGAR